MSLARTAEVSVVAHCALVAYASNVRLVGLVAAQRTIAVDSEMANVHTMRLRDRGVDGGKAVTRCVFFASLMQSSQ